MKTSGLYLQSFGVFHQNFQDTNQLKKLINEEGYGIQINSLEELFPIKSRIMPTTPSLINREDRATLNRISILSINSLSDLMANSPSFTETLSTACIYTSTDEPEMETELDAVKKVSTIVGIDNVLDNLGMVHKYSNPLNALRALTTNSLYQISKILNNHNEGFALGTTSLGGLMCIQNAYINSKQNPSSVSVCITSANLRSIDSLAFWYKLGQISINGSTGIIPAFGSAAILLTSDKSNSFAEILDLNINYTGSTKISFEDWNNLFYEKKISPDYIISYANGVKDQDSIELSFLQNHFPLANLKNYKKKLGYLGKAHHFFDLISCLLDEDIPVGSNILINSAGMGYGVGYLYIKKTKNQF